MTSHLKTLSILSYVAGGIGILWAGYLLLTAFLGGAMFAMGTAAGGQSGGPDATAAKVAGGVYLVIYSILALIALAVAVMNFLAGKNYASGRGYKLLFATAIMNLLPCFICCLVGLPLGVFSLIVLLNEDVKNLFKAVEDGKTFEEAMAPQVKEGE